VLGTSEGKKGRLDYLRRVDIRPICRTMPDDAIWPSGMPDVCWIVGPALSGMPDGEQNKHPASSNFAQKRSGIEVGGASHDPTCSGMVRHTSGNDPAPIRHGPALRLVGL